MTRHRNPAAKHDEAAEGKPESLIFRIIGGEFRGRKLVYLGDPRTRPMKDRVREAVFNLVSTHAKGKRAIDLFAGTGALGLEAISRGAASATFIEQHFPTARAIRQNAALLGIADRCEVNSANVFFWAQGDLPTGPEPWLVFCSPPYAFYVERQSETMALITRMWQAAPAGSVFVVESDNRFDMKLLDTLSEWDVREYPPAIVAVSHKA